MRTATVVIGLLLPCVALPAGGQEPICIVNGVRVATSICTRAGGLDPERIEQIEVLKGASAAAEYGREAAGGVILITTKAGTGLPAAAADDPLASHLFPPELVMAHQQAIGLTDHQRSAIQSAMREAQGTFVELQFQLSGEVETLQRLLQRTSLDEAEVLAQVDRVLAVERQVKRAQLRLMVRIKNQLTEQQQAVLATLRR